MLTLINRDRPSNWLTQFRLLLVIFLILSLVIQQISCTTYRGKLIREYQEMDSSTVAGQTSNISSVAPFPTVQSPYLNLQVVEIFNHPVYNKTEYEKMRRSSKWGLYFASIPAIFLGGFLIYLTADNMDKNTEGSKGAKGILGILLGAYVLFMGVIGTVAASKQKVKSIGILTDSTLISQKLETLQNPGVLRLKITPSYGKSTFETNTDSLGKARIDLNQGVTMERMPIGMDSTELLLQIVGTEYRKNLKIPANSFMQKYLYVQNQSIAIRKGPTNSQPAIARGEKDQEYTVLDDRGSWLKVELPSGVQGWCQRNAGQTFYGPKFPKPKYNPNISASVRLVEPSGNDKLDAGETGDLVIIIQNSGKGEAYNLKTEVNIVSGSNLPNGLSYGIGRSITRLNPDQIDSVIIPLSATEELASGTAKLEITSTEFHGFDISPIHYSFPTAALKPPQLKISDMALDDDNQGESQGDGNGQLELGEIAEIRGYVQNLGTGEAQNVTARIKLDSPETGKNLLYGSPTDILDLGNIAAGKYKPIYFVISTNKRYGGSDVPIMLNVSERRPRFSIEEHRKIPLNRPIINFQEVLVQGQEDQGTMTVETLPDLNVDVDQNIPISKSRNSDAMAVILGVENYSRISPATYARRDAMVFREYAVKVLGVPDDGNHIYMKKDNEVTLAELQKLFTGESWLARRAQTKSDVYIFFSGHGAPDLKTQEPYLIPADGDVNYPEQTGINLKTIYSEVEKLNARSVTFFIDACFSGMSREQQILLADGRPPMLRVKDPVLSSEKQTVFTASSGVQISSGYPDRKHGLFTYFLLKGLHGEADLNYDKSITVEELEQYLTSNVSTTAGTLDREQTPRVSARDKSRILVKY